MRKSWVLPETVACTQPHLPAQDLAPPVLTPAEPLFSVFPFRLQGFHLRPSLFPQGPQSPPRAQSRRHSWPCLPRPCCLGHTRPPLLLSQCLDFHDTALLWVSLGTAYLCCLQVLLLSCLPMRLGVLPSICQRSEISCCTPSLREPSCPQNSNPYLCADDSWPCLYLLDTYPMLMGSFS